MRDPGASSRRPNLSQRERRTGGFRRMHILGTSVNKLRSADSRTSHSTVSSIYCLVGPLRLVYAGTVTLWHVFRAARGRRRPVASGRQARRGNSSNFLPNSWLPWPRPPPARASDPRCSGRCPFRRSSLSLARPLRSPPPLVRTRRPPHRDKQVPARHQDTRPYAPIRGPVPASGRRSRYLDRSVEVVG